MTGFTRRERADRQAGALLARTIHGDQQAVTDLYNLLVAAGRVETIPRPTTAHREHR